MGHGVLNPSYFFLSLWVCPRICSSPPSIFDVRCGQRDQVAGQPRGRHRRISLKYGRPSQRSASRVNQFLDFRLRSFLDFFFFVDFPNLPSFVCQAYLRHYQPIEVISKFHHLNTFQLYVVIAVCNISIQLRVCELLLFALNSFSDFSISSQGGSLREKPASRVTLNLDASRALSNLQRLYSDAIGSREKHTTNLRATNQCARGSDEVYSR